MRFAGYSLVYFDVISDSDTSLPKSAPTILVVDDDDAVRDVVCLQLRTSSYHAVPCGSAAEALDVLTRLEVDAVVSDIRMPGMSGIELLGHIHANHPDLPVILMTAYADLDTAVSAVKQGAFDFIIKPYKPDHLLHAVEKAIRFRQLAMLEQGYRKTLEEFNAEIESLIAERTMNLMALTVADKVRNPAFIIACRVKKLLADDEMPKKFREALGEISEEAIRLEEIVQGFQALLKSRESWYEHCDLRDLLAEVMLVAEKDAAVRQISLVSQFPAEPLRVNMQKNLLRTAFFHIVRNSIEASSQGGSVSIEAGRDGESAVVTIADSGHGIAPELLGKIFEPFYSTKEHGFGMGLPLVKQIVAEHMGEITVRSEEGTGTAFALRFPLRWKQQGDAPSCPV